MAELTDLPPAELAAKLDQIERDYGSHGLAWVARNLRSLIALVRKLIAERDAMRDRLDAAAKVCDWRAAREGKVTT